MTPILERSLDKHLDALIGLAAEAELFLAGCGVPGPVAFKVQLALEETVRNLIEHDDHGRIRHIQVRIEAGPASVAVVLEDDGDPFDPRSAPAFDPARTLAARTSHGMGVHLLRAFMDEIHYDRVGARNRLRLVVAR